MNFLKDTDKRSVEDSVNIRETFQACVTLLQNSMTIDEFTENLTDTFNIFCMKDLEIETLKNIEDKLNNQNLKELKNKLFRGFDQETEREKEEQKNQYNRIYLPNDRNYNLIKDTKYSNYFKSKVLKLSKLFVNF